MDSLTRILNAPALVRRAAAVTLLVLAGAAAVATVGEAVDSLMDRAEDLHARRVHLGRLQSVLALKPALEAAQKSTSEANGPEFLHGASDAVIRANLQTQLDAIAKANKVAINSVGNAPVLEQRGMRFAGLRANLSGSHEGIQGTIYAIETAKPYLIIRQARINSTLKSQAAKAGPEDLVLQIQFYGALPPADRADAGATGAIQ